MSHLIVNLAYQVGGFALGGRYFLFNKK